MKASDLTGTFLLLGFVGVAGFITYKAFGKKDEKTSSARGGVVGKTQPSLCSCPINAEGTKAVVIPCRGKCPDCCPPLPSKSDNFNG